MAAVPSRLGADPTGGYGWVSIVLHWATVAVLFPLWFVGYATSHPGSENVLKLIHTHTTIAICAYALLLLRVLWRFREGHPAPLPRQRGWSYQFGKAIHFLLLLAIAVMLVSGPIMAWSGGDAIHVFSAAIPSPLPKLPQLSAWLLAVHRTTSRIIMLAILVHVCAVLKRVVFNHDGTLGRMLMAGRRTTDR
ncbi:MAG TPA: cytochrome b/b6 domain-containing protein [Steroidobacteraceae bacterium]|nr:cytochrome b/b6 domain-containing protein [Steroidobacteraceae bacterium]